MKESIIEALVLGQALLIWYMKEEKGGDPQEYRQHVEKLVGDPDVATMIIDAIIEADRPNTLIEQVKCIFRHGVRHCDEEV